MRPDTGGRAGPAQPGAATEITAPTKAQDHAHRTGRPRQSVPPIERDLDAVVAYLLAVVAAVPGIPPLLGTPEWTAADDATRLASLAGYMLGAGVVDELDPRVVATRLAGEVAAGRLAHRQALAEASSDVSGALDWRRYADRWVPRDEIMRRRAQPGPPSGGTA